MALVQYTNEFGRLQTIALYKPRPHEIFQGDPKEAMYIARPNPEKVLQEFESIVVAFRNLGIRVLVLEDETEKLPVCPNMIYLRDVAGVIGQSIIPARMKHMIRQGEPKKFQTLLTEQFPKYGAYINDILNDEKMEGADIFVLSNEEIAAYIGSRTDGGAVDKIARRLGLVVKHVPANIQKVPQHLLGGMHIVANDLLLRRPKYCAQDIKGLEAFDLEETTEVTQNFAMNIVTLSPREVLMPSNCPGVQAKLEEAGIKCHVVQIEEIHKMGGGLACMTLPLKRSTR